MDETTLCGGPNTLLNAVCFATLLLSASGCVLPATEVVILLGTDAPTTRALTITGSVSGLGSNAVPHVLTRMRSADGGGLTLPGTFAVTPGTASPGNAVRLDVTATVAAGLNGQPAIVLHRTARFTFTSHATTSLEMFLPMACANAAQGCTTRGVPCTVTQYCEDHGQTCGDRGICIALDVTPTRTDGGVVALDGAGSSPDAPTVAACDRPMFPASAAWNQPIDSSATDPQSDALIAGLASAGGWGNPNALSVDETLHVVCDPANAAPRAIIANPSALGLDCDLAPIPLPIGGHLQGETGWDCLNGGDCTLLVVEPLEQRLYESYHVVLTDGQVNSCPAIWDTSTYLANGRGDECGSADSAGLPMTPMLFDPDEVATGHIDHALHFTLPGNRFAVRSYVHPGTHAGLTSGSPTALPFGARFRLRADRVDAVLAGLPNDYARTVARAMRTYGMFLANTGQGSISATDDTSTSLRWDNTTANRAMATNLGANDLSSIQVTDFEVLDSGPRFTYDGNCARTPLTH